MADYAIVNDYAEFMFINVDKAPASAERLLARAGELIEYAVRDNLKVNANIIVMAKQTLALKLATCAQVEYWLNAGEDTAVSRQIKSYSSGDISVTFADGTETMDQLSKRSRMYLNKLGLLYKGVKPHITYESGRYI